MESLFSLNPARQQVCRSLFADNNCCVQVSQRDTTILHTVLPVAPYPVAKLHCNLCLERYMKTRLCWKHAISECTRLINRISANEVRDITNISVLFFRQLFVFNLYLGWDVACSGRLTVHCPRLLLTVLWCPKFWKRKANIYNSD